jgi:uncharacterized protein YciI
MKVAIPLLLGVWMAATAFADDDPTVRDQVFLVVLEPGPAWIEGEPVTEQPLQPHGSYLLRNYAAGRLVEAGPFTDDTGGAILYRADTIEEVEDLLAEDPGIASGILVPVTIRPWLLREWDHYLPPSTQRAAGTFVPRRSGLGEPDEHESVAIARQLLEKRFAGDLVGEGRGEMLMATTPVTGSAGYVAIERISATLAGREGTFLLQHSASMIRGEPGWLKLTVVPDSGTGGLEGIDGEMQIEMDDGEYRYTFDYTLPEGE